jgi:hypothetical protein
MIKAKAVKMQEPNTPILVQSINAATGETIVRPATPEEEAAILAVRNAPPPVPSAVSRRQLLIALTAAGLITEAEALAAAKTGDVPAAIDTVFAKLPKEDALAARITWATMTQVERDHPLVQAIIDAQIAPAEQVDALFRAAAQL